MGIFQTPFCAPFFFDVHTVEQHSPIYGHISNPVLCPVFFKNSQKRGTDLNTYFCFNISKTGLRTYCRTKYAHIWAYYMPRFAAPFL